MNNGRKPSQPEIWKDAEERFSKYEIYSVNEDGNKITDERRIYNYISLGHAYKLNAFKEIEVVRKEYWGHRLVGSSLNNMLWGLISNFEDGKGEATIEDARFWFGNNPKVFPKGMLKNKFVLRAFRSAWMSLYWENKFKEEWLTTYGV